MSKKIENQIKKCEQRLRLAMISSDLIELDKILAPELMFTNHFGKLITKQDDLNAHKSGAITILDIKLFDQKILVLDQIAIVSVKANIVGVFDNQNSNSNLRFTRVWRLKSDIDWQIIAGHSSVVV